MFDLLAVFRGIRRAQRQPVLTEKVARKGAEPFPSGGEQRPSVVEKIHAVEEEGDPFGGGAVAVVKATEIVGVQRFSGAGKRLFGDPLFRDILYMDFEAGENLLGILRLPRKG